MISLRRLYKKHYEPPTSDAFDITGAEFRQHILNSRPLPSVGTGVTIDNEYSKGDLHVNLGLIDGFKDEVRKITVCAIKSNALRLREKG